MQILNKYLYIDNKHILTNITRRGDFTSVNVGENLKQSLGFAFENTFKKIGRWILLSVLLPVAIIQGMSIGSILKVFRNEEPDFSKAGKSLIVGLTTMGIMIIYLIVPIVLIMILPMIPAVAVVPNLVLILSIVGYINLFLLCIVTIPGVMQYARTGSFKAAFKFGQIFAMIKTAGWGKYLIFTYIITAILIAMFVLLPMLPTSQIIMASIPLLGMNIVNILISFPATFLLLFGVKYLHNLFS